MIKLDNGDMPIAAHLVGIKAVVLAKDSRNMRFVVWTCRESMYDFTTEMCMYSVDDGQWFQYLDQVKIEFENRIVKMFKSSDIDHAAAN